MNDTSLEIDKKVHALAMSRTAEERLIMGCSMFDVSKQIVRDSIIEKNPQISKKELKQEIFKRFYGCDFEEQTLKKICLHLSSNTSEVSQKR